MFDQTPVPPAALPRPCLRLVGLHVRGLRAIRRIDLPQDGLGWQGQMPDLILLAGGNGSGKTALLEFLTAALGLLAQPLDGPSVSSIPRRLAAQEAWAEFELESCDLPRTSLRFLVGDERFVETNKTENCWWIARLANGGGVHGSSGKEQLRRGAPFFREATTPAVVFLPSEGRTLIVPPESCKAAGKVADDHPFVHRWRPPAAWKDSLEAILYSLRGEDRQASERGPFPRMGCFDAYAEAFRRLSEESKYLEFQDGKLVVKIAGSTVVHELDELSSGEKQVLLLSGELLRHWRPGSLILIDEPELHLHPHWQTRLYEALRYWQEERGGQVILATQSTHLVEIADEAGMVLLGSESP